ncbi:MAG: chromosomal replication initiator protein DnaA [candidate division WOR-3 bacterium]
MDTILNQPGKMENTPNSSYEFGFSSTELKANSVNDGSGTVSEYDIARLFWDKVLNVLSSELTNKEGFTTWLLPTKGISMKNNILTVQTPNHFFIDWISQYYLKMIELAVKKVSDQPIKVCFVAANEVTQEFKDEIEAFKYKVQGLDNINERYTFSNFIVGESNRLAYASAKAVAESPARSYNPLFIYGGVGLGKTHLLQAIGNHAKKINPLLKILYTPAENLFIELIQAIGRGNTLSFKQRYRSCDILLIDDIHYLKGKERLQEEIFHLFNYLHQAGKQVAFTSDRPPYEIPTIEERLASRLQAGLVVDIQPPELETRIAIIKRKAEEEGFPISQDIAYLIASRVTTNIRLLEGVLIRLIAMSSIRSEPITKGQVEAVLKAIIPPTVKITADQIVQATANEYNISPSKIRTRQKTKVEVEARQVAMYLMRQILNYTLKDIGDYFGGRDHTTVLHACQKIEQERRRRPDFDDKIKKITQWINYGYLV